jgi:4-amino-4-deoxy-L-arabinose transferase-like glycosyltransferase
VLPLTNAARRIARLPNLVLFAATFIAVALAHLTLLHLPYYWDEGGYYVPAALDFYHRWTLIPEFTNAHPPLPNVVLGLLWHVFGLHILVTRLTAAAFAAAGLVAVFRLAERFTGSTAALACTLLTAIYPIWFAQSTLAHADIFAAAFTLAAFALYFRTRPIVTGQALTPTDLATDAVNTRGQFLIATLFTLAALSKETAIAEPATLAALELLLLILHRASKPALRAHFRWLAALSFPAFPLALWFAYHHHKTGFTFGNPEYLRYNATANFTAAHIATALRYRFVHLFWQRDIWLPIVCAISCLLLVQRKNIAPRLTRPAIAIIAALLLANWIFFSVLGGALLTRYLLPIYPLLLLLCVALWRERTQYWPALVAITAAAFISAWWINPPVSFAPEDNLTYRDMIVVHQEATHFIEQHYPNATVLTAWPVAADLSRPELGYVSKQIKVTAIESFSLPDILQAAQKPENFDTAIIFTTHYMSPSLQQYLTQHPTSARGSEFSSNNSPSPTEIAALLHGRIVWQDNQNGEWAAVLRFDRAYEASLKPSPMRLR